MTTSSLNILITGASGQLGHTLQMHPLAQQHNMIARSHQMLDITDLNSVKAAIELHQPDIVINAAAYTAVDKAETEQARCFMINRDGAHNLAVSCEAAGIPLIHVSTDYVFDGKRATPYLEHDATLPLNVYGESKLAGEAAVRMACKKHVILRVSGIHSLQGHNFLNTILRLANERTELNMVGDQITCPTYAGDIAGAIYTICEKIATAGNNNHFIQDAKVTPATNHHAKWGTYHYCSNPPASWYDFASAILEHARSRGTVTLEKLNRITTDQYKTPATRPAYSVLNCDKIQHDYGISQPNWRDSLTSLLEGNH